MKRKHLITIPEKEWNYLSKIKSDYGHGFIQYISNELKIRRATLSMAFNHRLMREDLIQKIMNFLKIREKRVQGN